MGNEPVSLYFVARVDLETGAPYCELLWGEKRGRMTPDEMRGVGQQCFDVAALSEIETRIFHWGISIGMSPESALKHAYALAEFEVPETV